MSNIHFEDELGVDIRNTRSMCMDPSSPDEFHMMDRTDGGTIELLPVMTGEAFGKLVAYPIIVEAWEKKKAGRQRRAWEAAFTQAERNKISRYHGRFYKWYLVTGTPKRVSCRLNTLTLLQRAVEFFAGLR
jgi:hypothetical protein